MSKKFRTTIQIKKDVRANLKKLGKKGDSYNDIIKRIIIATKGEK